MKCITLSLVLRSLIETLAAVREAADLGKASQDLVRLLGLGLNAEESSDFSELEAAGAVQSGETIPAGIQTAIDSLRTVRSTREFAAGGAARTIIEKLVGLGDQVRNYGAFQAFLSEIGTEFADDTKVFFDESDDDGDLYGLSLSVAEKNPALVRRLLEIFGADKEQLESFACYPDQDGFSNCDSWSGPVSMRDFADAITVEDGEFFAVTLSIGDIRQRVSSMETALAELGFSPEQSAVPCS